MRTAESHPPCKEFGDFLCRMVEELDRKIIHSLHPLDVWIGEISYQEDWWECRELVRKLSEGMAFSPSKPPKSKSGFPIYDPVT